MKGDVAEVPAIINSKTGATSAESREVASMRAVAEAYDSRSLHDFQSVLEVSRNLQLGVKDRARPSKSIGNPRAHAHCSPHVRRSTRSS